VINYLDNSVNVLFIYRIFKKLNIAYASFYVNAIPLPSYKAGSGLKRLKKIKFMTMKKLKHYFLHYLFLTYSLSRLKIPWLDNLLGIQPPEFIFVGGRQCFTQALRPNKRTKIIAAHCLDYDLYLDYKQRAPQPVIDNKYAVFLDEYYPLHPDFFINGTVRNPYDNYLDYYRELNSMLQVLEQKTGIPVVIAAHPRSEYEKMPDLFNGRKVIKNKTIELVANAEYALIHSSTSVNFPVLLAKPLIFLMPDKAKGGYFEQFSLNFAKQFGKQPFDLKNLSKINIESELSVNRQAYARYKEDYIKAPGSPEEFFWDITADAIFKVNPQP
jgi:hypothetical protein